MLIVQLQSKDHIEIEVKMDELDLTAEEKKATYEEIKAYVLEHNGLKVSHLHIAQVKQPHCPPDKETAIVEALKFYELIAP